MVFLNLGLGYKISNYEILETFKNLVEDHNIRLYMSNLMKSVNLRMEEKKVIKLIKKYYRGGLNETIRFI